jgi:hypothetical protein
MRLFCLLAILAIAGCTSPAITVCGTAHSCVINACNQPNACTAKPTFSIP